MEDKYSFQEMEPEQQNILRQNYKKETQPKPHRVIQKLIQHGPEI